MIACSAAVDRVGRRELLCREREHARAVDRDVPVADDDCALMREVEVEVLEVGVAVVPGNERGGRPRAREILPGDPEPPVGLGADGVDHRVVALEQVRVRDGDADVDVAEEAEAGARSRLLERPGHRLDVLVVGSHSQPDQAPRGRQPVEQVDGDGRILALQQRVSRVEAGRARADDGDAERPRSRARGQ